MPNPENGSEADRRTPECLYLRIHHRTKDVLETKYFRVSLDGKLEKAFSMYGVYNSEGKVVSGKISHPDIDSPEVRKEFNDQLNFWLNEWLPKQKKVAAKIGAAKTSRNASPKMSAPSKGAAGTEPASKAPGTTP